MTDTVDKATRSRMMAAVKGKHTKPELAVRRYLHHEGLRFRLHEATLPGKPDMLLPRYKVAINVHGCFWHRHEGCRLASMPASNQEFWENKFATNVQRDRRTARALRRLGWHVFTVWECQITDDRCLERLVRRIRGRAG